MKKLFVSQKRVIIDSLSGLINNRIDDIIRKLSSSGFTDSLRKVLRKDTRYWSARFATVNLFKLITISVTEVSKILWK